MYTDAQIMVGFAPVLLDEDSMKGRAVELYSGSCLGNSEDPDLIVSVQCQSSSSLLTHLLLNYIKLVCEQDQRQIDI